MNIEESKLVSSIKPGDPITWILYSIFQLKLVKIKIKSPPRIVPKIFSKKLYIKNQK